jgi:hypothetical protein
VLFFDCPEEEMERRLLKRGETSGRSDDNADTIRKRFRTFVEQSLPVIDHYEQQGKVFKISAVPTPDQVFVEVQNALDSVHGAAVQEAAEEPVALPAMSITLGPGPKSGRPSTEVVLTATAGAAVEPALSFA